MAKKGQLICQNETILAQFPLFYPKFIDSLQKLLICVNLKSVSIKPKDWANLGQFGPNIGPECNLNIKFCNIQHLFYQWNSKTFILCENEVWISKIIGFVHLGQFWAKFWAKLALFCKGKNSKSLILTFSNLNESIHAQKSKKKLLFEFLYPSPIVVNHGALLLKNQLCCC